MTLWLTDPGLLWNALSSGVGWTVGLHQHTRSKETSHFHLLNMGQPTYWFVLTDHGFVDLPTSVCPARVRYFLPCILMLPWRVAGNLFALRATLVSRTDKLQGSKDRPLNSNRLAVFQGLLVGNFILLLWQVRVWGQWDCSRKWDPWNKGSTDGINKTHQLWSQIWKKTGKRYNEYYNGSP